MDPKPDAAPPSLPGAGVLAELPAKGADLVDSFVALVRDRAVRPFMLVAKAIVFGIIVFAASIVLLTLLSIILVRVLTVYAFDGRVWISDLVVGGLFVVVGLVAWSQRTVGSARAEEGR
jgi:hypothetical protein